MQTIRLDSLLSFSVGDNPSRVKEAEPNFYAQDDFFNDLHGVNMPASKHECIINLIRTAAAPLSAVTADKKITSNYLRCDMPEDELDPWYFCYQFNEGRFIKQQISMFSQGTNISVRRLNLQMIREMMIHLPGIEKQRHLGQLYQYSVKQYDMMCKQAENMKAMTLAVMRKIEED